MAGGPGLNAPSLIALAVANDQLPGPLSHVQIAELQRGDLSDPQPVRSKTAMIAP
jgi:hypothetical protein